MNVVLKILFICSIVFVTGWSIGYHLGWQRGFAQGRWLKDLWSKK